jgi:hypothetical protein
MWDILADDENSKEDTLIAATSRDKSVSIWSDKLVSAWLKIVIKHNGTRQST